MVWTEGYHVNRTSQKQSFLVGTIDIQITMLISHTLCYFLIISKDTFTEQQAVLFKNKSIMLLFMRPDIGWKIRILKLLPPPAKSKAIYYLLGRQQKMHTKRQKGLTIDAEDAISIFGAAKVSSLIYLSILLRIAHSLDLFFCFVFCQWPFFSPTQHLMAWRGLLHMTESFRFKILPPSSLEGKVNSLYALGVNECEGRFFLLFFFLYVFYTLCSWLLKVLQ